MKLYTMDNCIYCKALKVRLAHEKIDYEEVKDDEVISSLGFETVPQMDIGDRILDFNASIAWLNERSGG